MQNLAELDLPYLDWNEPSFAADPFPEFRKARAAHPWLAKGPTGYAITSYQAMRDIMTQDNHLRPAFDWVLGRLNGEDTPWGRFMEGQLAALSGETHKILRATLASAFTPSTANRLRPRMRAVMEGLLKEWVPKRRIDFEEFASYYPVSVVGQMIGAPADAIPGLRKSLETLSGGFALVANPLDELNKVVLYLEEFMNDLIADHRANPPAEKDVLDTLIEAVDGGHMTHEQLLHQLYFLFVAGYDTSKNVLTYIMLEMTRNPDIYRRCAEDYHYCAKVVEEAVRLFNPGLAFRMTSQTFDYQNVTIPKGTLLFFPLSVSGHDARAFDDADRFDPDRPIIPDRRPIAFGLGRHTCLGQHIARALLQEGLHLIAQNMLEPRLIDKPTWRPFPGMWGIYGLPIEFTPVSNRGR